MGLNMYRSKRLLQSSIQLAQYSTYSIINQPGIVGSKSKDYLTDQFYQASCSNAQRWSNAQSYPSQHNSLPRQQNSFQHGLAAVPAYSAEQRHQYSTLPQIPVNKSSLQSITHTINPLPCITQHKTRSLTTVPTRQPTIQQQTTQANSTSPAFQSLRQSYALQHPRGFLDFGAPPDFVKSLDDKIIDQAFITEAVARVLIRVTILMSLSRVEEATILVYRAGRNLNNLLAPESFERGAMMHQLAMLYQVQGRLDEAEALLRACLDIALLNYGSVSTITAVLQISLAGVLGQRGKLLSERGLLQNGMMVLQRVHGMQHFCMGEAIFLASLTHLTLDLDGGWKDEVNMSRVAEVLMEALDMQTKWVGPNNPYMATNMRVFNKIIEDIMNETPSPDQAAKVQTFYNLAVAVYEHYLPQCQEYADLLTLFAVEDMNAGRYVQCRELCDKSMAIVKDLVAENSPVYMKRVQMLQQLNVITGGANSETIDTLDLCQEYWLEQAPPDYGYAGEAQFYLALQKYLQSQKDDTFVNLELARGKMQTAMSNMEQGWGSTDRRFVFAQNQLTKLVSDEYAIPMSSQTIGL